MFRAFRVVPYLQANAGWESTAGVRKDNSLSRIALAMQAPAMMAALRRLFKQTACWAVSAELVGEVNAPAQDAWQPACSRCCSGQRLDPASSKQVSAKSRAASPSAPRCTKWASIHQWSSRTEHTNQPAPSLNVRGRPTRVRRACTSCWMRRALGRPP
jgi:hypothetical protein